MSVLKLSHLLLQKTTFVKQKRIYDFIYTDVCAIIDLS